LLTVLSCYFLLFYFQASITGPVPVLTQLLVLIFAYRFILLFYFRPVSPNLDPCRHSRPSWYLLTVPSCFIFRPVSPNMDPCWHNFSSNDICLLFHLVFYFQANITWPCMWC
jgi:hypothetical protein